MIAVEYPPCKSAGVQRTLKFSELLQQFGWSPIVLTSSTHAYESLDDDYSYPEGVIVKRALGLDSLRHFRFRGKYLGITAMPDRYAFWFIPGVLKGIYLANKYKPQVIYSSFPYSTAHAIALFVSKFTGIPWVADFRDPAHHHYLPPAHSNALSKKVDEATVSRATKLVFATEKMREFYVSQYPKLQDVDTLAIENGFNEELISSLPEVKKQGDSFVVLHSGALIIEREPAPIIEALGQLRAQAEVDSAILKVELHFRGAEPKDVHQELINRYGLQECVKFLPSISYEKSVKEMMGADALLLMQGSSFNFQIPGKAYEYLATQKPVVTLTDLKGATAQLMLLEERCCVVENGNVDQAKEALSQLLNMPNKSCDITPYGRKNRTKQLASLLDTLCD